MPTYTNPGVYVSESAFVSRTARSNSSRSSAVFFGEASRGPEEATLVDSWSTFKTLYGDISPSYDLGYAVYHYFANGGRDAYIVRVPASGATKASATVTYKPQGTGSSVTATLFAAKAISKGTWGNSLKVNVIPSTITTATATQVPSFTLAVTLANSNGVDVEVERWNEVSVDPSSNRYLYTVINNYSKYITIDAYTSLVPQPTASATFTLTSGNTSFSSGSDGASAGVVASDYTTALSKLDVIEGVLLLNAVNRTDTLTVNEFLTKAESRGNSFVIIDPVIGDGSSSSIAGVVGNYNSSNYGAVYYPALKMVDPSKTGPGAIRVTAPGGAIAGAYVRTEIERNVAKAPAGYNVDVRGAIGLEFQFTEAQAGSLYSNNHVNMLKAVPGGGIIINGARTLDKDAPGKFIPTRRTLNYLKQVLKEATAFAVFEPNDSRLWDTLSIGVSGLLADFWRTGGLKGASAREAFYVICDSSNNTATTIDNGEVHIEVGVSLQSPAEFVVINISQWTGGSNTVETL